eukprot:TRINITY_DN23605_c0_g1_i1.p1 TRINITY_DN23605_c0_g1~~TRINITY_DN23605_c0_g1_i1.p1  ORF type:complete len:327 (-),score=45.46 TRINITY_DN23605_c0_g1_i1:29-1009(-)
MYVSEGDCILNCSHGATSCTPKFDGWVCNCIAPWNWESSCNTDFYNDYYTISVVYIVLGILFTIPGFLLFSSEIFFQIKKKNSRNATFIAKTFAALFAIIRIYHYADIAAALVYKTYSTPIALTQILFWLPDGLGISVYFLTTIMWLDMASSLKHLSTEKSKRFILARNIYIIGTIVFMVGGIVTSCLLVLANSLFYLIYDIWISVPLLVTVFFCLINIYHLSSQLHSIEVQLKGTMKYKNNILAIISIWFIVVIVVLVIYILVYPYFTTMAYFHLFHFILRALELIEHYLFFAILQQYVFKTTYKVPTTSTLSSLPPTPSYSVSF